MDKHPPWPIKTAMFKDGREGDIGIVAIRERLQIRIPFKTRIKLIYRKGDLEMLTNKRDNYVAGQRN